MTPTVALLLCFAVVFWLLREDGRDRPGESMALLIPALWVIVIASRPVVYWLEGTAAPTEGTALDGNPVDRSIYVTLILLALLVLFHRKIDWSLFVSQNKALLLLYFFLLLTVLWSDVPDASLKRWLKDVGSLPVALVLLTHPRPLDAIRLVYVRCAYFLFPVSVVLIKYFSEWGRNVTRSGDYMFTGIAAHKNSLGALVMVFGLMLLWDLYEMNRDSSSPRYRRRVWIRWGMVAVGVWLLATSNSQTALACTMVGILVYFGGDRLAARFRNAGGLLAGMVLLVATVVALNETFHVTERVVEALGRDMTFTGRTEIWRVVQEQEFDPVLGVGYLMFWDTARAIPVYEQLTEINTAHNGYLEMLLDGGMVGVALLILLLIVSGHRTLSRLLLGTPWGKVTFAFWMMALLYNWFESSYFRLGILWFTLLLCIIQYTDASTQGEALEEQPSLSSRVEEHAEAVT